MKTTTDYPQPYPPKSDKPEDNQAVRLAHLREALRQQWLIHQQLKAR